MQFMHNVKGLLETLVGQQNGQILSQLERVSIFPHPPVTEGVISFLHVTVYVMQINAPQDTGPRRFLEPTRFVHVRFIDHCLNSEPVRGLLCPLMTSIPL
jgi:hypothetical protein